MLKSLLDYFSKKRCEAHWPDPRRPLSSKILPSTIAAANTEVLRVIDASCHVQSGKRRGAYNTYTPEFKAKVARYGIENGNCQAARKFSTTDKIIEESSVRGWAKTYKTEVERKRKAGEEVSAIPLLPVAKRGEEVSAIPLLPVAKRGRPLLLGDTFDSEVSHTFDVFIKEVD